MKYLKILGLAALAAMAVMAFVGAGSASATVLCTQNLSEEECQEGHEAEQMYEPGNVIKGLAKEARLTSDLSNVVCKTSETEAQIETTGGPEETVTGSIKALNFKE